jgi:hypothetical protein
MTAQSAPYVDPRAGRIAAAITTAVLATVVLTGSGPLLAAQTAVFLIGAVFGLRRAPYSAVFRLLKKALRLTPPAQLESEAPLRFAQALGAVFGIAGLIGFGAGSTVVGTTAAALALVAAFLNAAFGICLGCEIYLVARRISGRAELTRFVRARTTVEGSSA